MLVVSVKSIRRHPVGRVNTRGSRELFAVRPQLRVVSLETDEDDDHSQAATHVDDAPATPSTSGQSRASGEAGRTGEVSVEADGFGAKGWALTAVLFVSVIVIPGIIYAYPYAAGGLGFTFFATYLALPLVPAALLGLVAVWSMTAAVADE